MDLEEAIPALQERVESWKRGKAEVPKHVADIESHLKVATEALGDGACDIALESFRDAQRVAKGLGI